MFLFVVGMVVVAAVLRLFVKSLVHVPLKITKQVTVTVCFLTELILEYYVLWANCAIMMTFISRHN